jgi:hypothetical protein
MKSVESRRSPASPMGEGTQLPAFRLDQTLFRKGELRAMWTLGVIKIHHESPTAMTASVRCKVPFSPVS